MNSEMRSVLTKVKIPVVVLFTVLCFSAVSHRPAFADGGAPPTSTPTATPTSTPTETFVPVVPTEFPTEIIFGDTPTPNPEIIAPDLLTAEDFRATPTLIPEDEGGGSSLFLLGFLFVGVLVLIGISVFAMINRSKGAQGGVP
jgi:hypothetical protein